MLPKQGTELVVPHFLHLFALVAMGTRPDIDGRRPGLGHLGQNRRQGSVPYIEDAKM